jgi:hypothetical protein
VQFEVVHPNHFAFPAQQVDRAATAVSAAAASAPVVDLLGDDLLGGPTPAAPAPPQRPPAAGNILHVHTVARCQALAMRMLQLGR